MLVGNFKRTSKRKQDSVLWASLEILFKPLRCINSKTTHNTLTADLFRLNNLRGTKPAFLTSKRYHDHLGPFPWESAPEDEVQQRQCNLVFLYLIHYSHFRETSQLFALRVSDYQRCFQVWKIITLIISNQERIKGDYNNTHSKAIPFELFLDIAPSSSTDVTRRADVSGSMMSCTPEQNRLRGIGYS